MNLKRKADRQLAARQLADAMLEAGALSAEIQPAHPRHPRALRIDVAAPGEAYIGVEIDGDMHDCLGGTWNTPQGVFLSPALGDVNPFHYGKLNVYTDNLGDLIWSLQRHLAMLADGRGYLARSDPRIVAMRERYRLNGWQWLGEAA